MMRWVVLTALLAGCTTNPYLSKIEADYAQKDIDQTPVGEQRWAKAAGISGCSAPDVYSKCSQLRGVKMTVLGSAPRDSQGRLWYQVEVGSDLYFVDSLNWITDTESEAARQKAVNAKIDCDRRGGVRIGMTAAEVRASCWGNPKSINRTTTSSGTREQWVYNIKSYVYLENGKVTAIQN